MPDPEEGGGCSRSGLITVSACGRRRRRARAALAIDAARRNPLPSAIPGIVFSGAIDGHLRAYSTNNGSIVWDVDTVQTYKTVNGVLGKVDR